MNFDVSFNEEECSNIIINYIVSQKDEQALLIDGEWGSGKTFFINNLIENINDSDNIKNYLKMLKIELNTNERKILNDKKIIPIISLYGLNSIEEIKLEILKKQIPIISKDNKLINSGIDFIASNLVNIAKIVKLELKDTLDNIKFENVDKFIENLNLINNKLIIFDDFERCNIEINSLMGYINELVEHDKTKVLLISNEKELVNNILYKDLEKKYLAISSLIGNGSNQNREVKLIDIKSNNKDKLEIDLKTLQEINKLIFVNNKSYNKMKEKVIGNTIKFKATMEKNFDCIIHTYINDSEVINTMKSLKYEIISILKENEFFNYRCLIYWLIKTNRIFNTLRELKQYNNKYKQDLNGDILKSCLYYSIQIKKSNKVDLEYNFEVNKKNNLYNSYKEERVKYIYLTDRKEYSLRAFSIQSLKNYMFYGYLNNSDLIKDIELYTKIKEDENNLGIMINNIERNLLCLSKEDLKEYLNNILDRLSKKYSIDFQYYNIVLSLIFYLEDNEVLSNIYNKEKLYFLDKVIKAMQSSIEESKIIYQDYIYINTDNKIYQDKINLLNEAFENNNVKISELNTNRELDSYISDSKINELPGFLRENPQFNYLTYFNIEIIKEFIKNAIGNSENKVLGEFTNFFCRLQTWYPLKEVEHINKYEVMVDDLIKFLNTIINKTNIDIMKKLATHELLKNLHERKAYINSYRKNIN